MKNILLVFADQMRGMDMGCAGNDAVASPALDRLAASGARFTEACANSPVCTPSRGSLLTGCYPRTHRAFLNDIPVATHLPTLGTLARDAGMATGYIGKWHLDGCPRNKFTPPGPRRLGFDDFWAVHNCSHSYMNGFYYRDTPEPIRMDGYDAFHQTDLAVGFMESAVAEDRPFCCVLSWGPPHAPYGAVPQEYRDRFPPENVRLRDNVPEGATRIARNQIAGYYAHIAALDDCMETLLAALDRLGAADETLVVFTSDHGDMLHSQGSVKKQQPWRESVSIPLLMRLPGVVPADRVCDGLVGVVDLLPTVCSLAGLEIPETVEGTDCSALAAGDAESMQDDVYLMDVCSVDQGLSLLLPDGWRGLRTERYTYARAVDGPWVLYDDVEDPFQLRNLVDDPEAKPIRDELDARLEARMAERNDAVLGRPEIIREEEVIELWNIRERELHGDRGRFLD